MSVASGRKRRDGAKDKKGRATPAGVRGVLKGDVPTSTRRTRPDTVEGLFGGGDTGHLLRTEWQTEDVYAWFRKRHLKGIKLIGDDGFYCTRDGKHKWRVPYGVRQSLKVPLIHSQIVTQYPWFVTWISPKTNRRMKKYFGSLIQAIDFIATKAQYVDPEASVVSRHGYDIPPKLRGKLPRKVENKTRYWCPMCMNERRFRRNGQDFFAQRKEWSDEKQRFIWKERRLAVLECTVCGCTNRDHKFRRSNQPWEVRKFAKGARRAKRR